MEDPVAGPSPEQALPAGFWVRGGAYLIDSLVLLVPTVVLIFAIPGPLGGLARLAIAVAYFTVLPVVWSGQTIGKRFAGITIVRMDGQPLGYGAAFIRWVGYLLSGLTLCIGFLIQPFTENKRALQDFLAGTRVLQTHPISDIRKIILVLVVLLLPGLGILGIVAAIAIPSFARARNMALEGQTRAELAALRSGLVAYYAELNSYPADLRALAPRYVTEIQPAQTPLHAPSAQVTLYDGSVCSGKAIDGTKLRDTGGWGYVADTHASCWGTVFVDSTQPTARTGTPWFSE